MVDSTGPDMGCEEPDLAALPAGGGLLPCIESSMDNSCGPTMGCESPGVTFLPGAALTGATAKADGPGAAAAAEVATLAARAAPGSILGTAPAALGSEGPETHAKGKSRLATVSTSEAACGSMAALNDRAPTEPFSQCQAASPKPAKESALPSDNMLTDNSSQALAPHRHQTCLLCGS